MYICTLIVTPFASLYWYLKKLLMSSSLILQLYGSAELGTYIFSFFCFEVVAPFGSAKLIIVEYVLQSSLDSCFYIAPIRFSIHTIDLIDLFAPVYDLTFCHVIIKYAYFKA